MKQDILDPMLSRRIVCLAPLAQIVTRSRRCVWGGKMQLCMYMDDFGGAGYQKSPEGWVARAGIKFCEFTSSAVDAFLKTEDVAAARRLLLISD